VKHPLAVRLWPFVLLFVLAWIPCSAQVTSATVTGTVTDPTGAVIPSATVTLTNLNSGVGTTTTSSSNGLYRVSGLLPGIYRATVSHQGFRSVIKDGIELHVEDEIALNFALEVGSASETITVQSGTSVIETDSPAVSQVIESEQIQQTPLNGRNVMNLVALTPGVVPQGGTAGAPTQNQAGGLFTQPGGWNNYQIGGGLAGQGSEFLDGAPLNVIGGHISSLVPTQDAIGEFRVETSVVDAQYGNFGGGVVSFVTRTGTRNLHGTIYEYLRNTVLDANDFFDNLSGQPRNKLIQNQYGAAGGGPLARSGKAFFFTSWEGFRLTSNIPNAGRVPTSAELGGNFTADPPIYDPTTGHQFICNGVLNEICPDRFDPTANYMANVINMWPAPNTQIGSINYSRAATASSANNQFNERVDWALGAKQKLFARYTYWKANQHPSQVFYNSLGLSDPSILSKPQQIALGDTLTVNDKTVVDMRLSYLRFIFNTTPAPTNVDLASFGPFYAAIENQVTYKMFPDPIVTGTIEQPFYFLNVFSLATFNNYVGSGSVTRVAGRHSISFGGEFRRSEQYSAQTSSTTGLHVFAGVFTSCFASCTTPGGAPATPTPIGAGATPIADFLLGSITLSYGFTEVTFPDVVSNYGGVFVSDTFQYRPRLNFVYGVRWEMPGGFTEKHNRNTVLLPSLANPLVLVDSQAYGSRSDLKAHRTLFSPRVGMVFRANSTTTLRAGYSLTYLPQDVGLLNGGPSYSPINAATTFVPFGAQLSNPLGGSTTLLEPIGRKYNGTQFLGQSIVSRLPDLSFPYQQDWNATVQRMFGRTAVVQLGYVGSRGEHMPMGGYTQDINQIPDKYVGLPASQLSQSLRPYPDYQIVNANNPYLGDTYYNSLQATFTDHLRVGGTVLVNYTFSRLRGNSEASTGYLESYNAGGPQDYDNLRGEVSLLSFDTPNRLVVNYAVDLPFGRGKKFLSASNGLENAMVGGWNLSGITTFASGFPMALSAGANTLSSVYGAGTIRPNYVAGCAKSIGGSIVQKVQQGLPFLNQNCFTQPGDTSFGNEPRVDSTLRSQGIDNWDLSLGKMMTLHDALNLEFKAEAFNVVNRVQFGEPSTTSGTAIFGVISSQVNQPRVLQMSLRVNF